MELHHIAINVGDIEKARAFYRDALGLPEIARESLSGNDGAWFQLGSHQLHLQGRKESAAKTDQHFAVITGEPEALKSRVVGFGGRVSEGKLLTGFTSRFFVHDPDGNRIEILGRR